MLGDLKVVEFEGLAPSVFCGHYFADQGATVIIVARHEPAPFSMPTQVNMMNRYKKCICLSLKDREDRSFIHQLIKQADVLIDPYRPGILQKMGFGSEDLHKINKGIIFLRVSGYGQKGKMAHKPGHDINYLSIGGIIPQLNQKGGKEFPNNFMADFVSSSLGITAVLAALEERKRTKVGQTVDCSLAEGCKYFSKLISHNYKEDGRGKIQIGYITLRNKQYCISSSKGSEIEKTLKNSQEIVDELGNRKYAKLGEIEISQVLNMDSWRAQIRNPTNPFSSITKAPKLPQRGQHSQEIKAYLNSKL